MNDLNVRRQVAKSEDFDEISLLAYESDGITHGKYRQFLIKSAFQPILSLAHSRPVGFEALMRGVTKDKEVYSPLEILAVSRNHQ